MTPEENSNLPLLVQKRLAMQAYIDAIDTIVETHGLSFQQEQVLLDILYDLLPKKLKLAEVPDRLQQDIKLDDTKFKSVLLDFLGLVLWFQDYVSDVMSQILKLGGSKDKYLDEAAKVLVPENVYWFDFVDLLVEGDIDIDTVSAVQMKNLFNILLSTLQDTIKKEELVNILPMPPEQGGLGIEQEVADIIAVSIISEISADIIKLDMFTELDEIRKKVLGDKFTSILEAKPIEIAHQLSSQSSQLVKQMAEFLALPEIKQINEQLEEFKSNNFEKK
jgi:hypothetical protein